MSHHAKAPSSATGSTARQAGSARPHVLLALAALTALAATLALGLTLASATSPTVTVEAAEVGFTSARAQGEVDPGEKETSYHFEYVSQAKFEATAWAEATPTGFGSLPEGINTPTAVEPATLTGLDSATEYHLRLLAENEDGTEEDATTFTTQTATAPGTLIGGASAIKVSKAHISGEVEPGGGDVDPLGPVVPISWELEYTKASGPPAWQAGGSGTVSGEEAESSGQVEVGADLAHLSAATEYLFRLKATRGGHSTTSSSANFTTASSAGPTPITEPAQDLAPTHASLQGLVNPNGEPTTYWFEYGPTAAYGTSVPASKDAVPGSNPEVAEGDNNAFAAQELQGLQPATTYHYRLLAKNASGEVQGDDVAFTTLPEAAAQSCANEQARSEQHSSYLPDCRAWEMVSPPDKAGGSVGLSSARMKAAAQGSAIAYFTLTPFGDVQGTGVESEYIAERTGQSGASGWASHAITPKQEPLFVGATTQTASPAYVSEFSPDLSMGIFRSWSPLTDAPDVAQVENLYVRKDLLTPGPGTWSLATACPACAGTPLSPKVVGSPDEAPWLAGQSADFRQVIFESRLDLTGDGTGVKLYMSDEGSVHLLGLVPSGAETSCGGTGPACVLPSGNGSSIAGLGARVRNPLEQVISADGSRVNFSAPAAEGSSVDPDTTNVYQRDTHGTPSTADDTTVLLNAFEGSRAGAESSGAVYQGASADGLRVLFTSGQALTDDASTLASPHLYMWHRAPNDEVQRLTVAASGGTFTLTFDGASTGALPAGASAAQVGAALGSLSSIGGAGGKVEVTGGPGDDAGASPYLVTFGGALGGEDVPLMTADGSSLTGGAPAADVAPWVAGGGHLTLIDRDEEPGDAPAPAVGVIGTSENASYVYFVDRGQLVAGAPAIGFGRTTGVYVWHDGKIGYIGALTLGGGSGRTDWERDMPIGERAGQGWRDIPSRVSPDGRTLVFMGSNGSGLTGYDQTGCSFQGKTGCDELYVYQAASKRLTCASCPSGPPASNVTPYINSRYSGVTTSPHQSHALSDDGRRLFFTTADSLVPEDTNGRADAYEYDTSTGSVALLSSGKGTTDSYFVDASASGDDAFFATRERLVGWDTDSSYDIYDARLGGGFPEPPSVPAACEGEACKAAAGAVPAAPSTASQSPGPGNLRTGRCSKGKVRKHGKCVKKHRKHHKRHARVDHGGQK